MTRAKTLYISDLDGTLLSDKAEISGKTTDIINRLISRGLLFTCATARSFASAGGIIGKLNLKLPLATYNGAFLINPVDGGIIEACLMDKEKIRPLAEAIRPPRLYPLVYAMINGAERVSWIQGCENTGMMNYLSSRAGDCRLRPVSDYEQLFEGEIFYITIIGSRDEVFSAEGLFRGNRHAYCHIQEDTYNKGEFWLEAYRFDATKRHAALKIKKLVNASEMVCFGDNINDLPMFEASDKCYAVSNANRNVKDAATGIILSNNEDGVAMWLDEHYRD